MYGTFMGNNVRERLHLRVKEETESMWTYILNNKDRFYNINYNESDNYNLNDGII